jgi:hypothetical protein
VTEHRRLRPVQDYGCGVMRLLVDAIEDHEKKYGGAKPAAFTLHPPAYQALCDEQRRRFGEVPEDRSFMGIFINVCPCGRPFAEDLVHRASDGKPTPL